MTDKKRFYLCDDGSDCDYTIVARDLEHAKQILRDHGVELCDDGGWSHPIDHPAVAHTEWKEIPRDRAEQIKVWLGDNGGAPQARLADCDLGDFFSSEF